MYFCFGPILKKINQIPVFNFLAYLWKKFRMVILFGFSWEWDQIENTFWDYSFFKDITKMFLVRNTVYDNQNNIPFYNPSHEPEDRTSNPPDYGTSDQTYIIDGSGTYRKVASVV